MKKLAIILAILTVFGALVFAGCDDKDTDDDNDTVQEVSLKEPTVSISESVTFSFKNNTTTTKKATTTKPSTTKQKETTTVYVAPTTEYVEPTTAYVEPTTVYVAPTTQYVESTGYISYSEACTRNFTEADVAGVSADTVQSVINDIYAHHGYIFKTPSIKAYYESQSWYKGTVSSQSEAESTFNSYEIYNKNFLSHYR
jgi:hypothetical protein